VVVVVLGAAAATALLVLLAWATSTQPRATVSATAPDATGSAATDSTADRSAMSPDGSASKDGTPGSAQSTGPATTPAAPEPFIQNFGPFAGTPLPPVASPTAPVPFPVGDGCDHGYGEPNQCVPLQFPPGVAYGCAWLRAHGFGPLAVHGTDRLGLDPNRDGVACGTGDG